MARGKYTGPICPIHPELKGARYTRGRCVACNKMKTAEWRKSWTPEKRALFLEKMRKAARVRHILLKRTVMDHYGGKCKKCPETDIDMLTVDHLGNDGHSHRKALGATRFSGSGSLKVYRWLIANNFPRGFGVLCFNHNIKKHLVWMRRKYKN